MLDRMAGKLCYKIGVLYIGENQDEQEAIHNIFARLHCSKLKF